MCLYLIIHVKRCQDKNMTCHRNPSPTDKNNENSEKTKFEVNTCVQCHCYSKRIIHIVGM